MRSIFTGLVGIAAFSAASFGQCTPHWDYTVSTPGVSVGTGYVGAMIEYQGDLVMSGSFMGIGGVANTKYIARYNKATNTWSPFGLGLGDAPSNSFGTSFAKMGGDLYVGGFFADASGVADTKSIARWDGTQFNSLGQGWANNSINQVQSLLSSSAIGGPRVYIGGGFDNIAGQPAANIAMWDGTALTPLATSMNLVGINAVVFSMAMFDDGQGGGTQLYIGGRFADIDGVPTKMIARWNGTTWSGVGTNLGNTIATGEIDNMLIWNNELYVSGNNIRVDGVLQQVAKWNGVTWTAVGQNPTGRVWTLETFDDGSGEKLYAGGTAVALGRIFRLEGNVWTPYGGGADSQVIRLFKFAGEMFMGGSFANVNGVPASHIISRVGCPACGTADFDGDGDIGTDADIEAFFACLAGNCCATCYAGGADFNADGDIGTDADIEAFFRVLAGGNC